MLVFYASSASSIPKAQSRAESVFLQLKFIHPSKGRNPKAEKSREKDGTCGLASFDRDFCAVIKETSDGKSPFLLELMPKAGQSRRTFNGRFGDVCALFGGVFRQKPKV